MRCLALMALLTGLVSVAVGARAAIGAPATSCTTCHRGIEDAHPKKALTCTQCHRGDATAQDAGKAHTGMWANPSDLRVVEQTCGACHKAIVARVKSSIMAHRSGTQSGTLFPNGLQSTREDVRFSMAPVATIPGVSLPKSHPLPKGAVARLEPLPTFEEGGDVFFDLLRKECTSCHLWTQPRGLKANRRAAGCAASHMPYAEDGRYQGGDVAVSRTKQGRPMRHVLTRQVPITQCATCHNGGSRAAMNFRGMMEAPPEGKQTFVYDQDLLHGHAYSEQTPDVHFTKGMVCIDCHTEREVHGDGQIYAKRHYEVEIRCETCHGTPDRIATGVTSQGRRLRNVFSPAGPNPTGLVTLVSKMTGATHAVPRAQPLCSYVDPAGRLEYDFKKLGFAHNPIVPHTVVKASRSCESCHGNPRALGLGLFTTREHPKLSEFKQPIDYRWDRIVDEDGVSQQVTTVDGARPLSREEMDRLRRAPYKR